jgi:excisionase family DNA binding protein
LKLISAQEVAKIMGCAESTIRTNAKKGTLGFTAVKVGSLWKFRDEEVYEYVYGKNWRDIAPFGVEVPDVIVPTMSVDEARTDKIMNDTPVAEPEPTPSVEKPAPVNVIPLGAREVTFNEDSGNLESGSGQI